MCQVKVNVVTCEYIDLKNCAITLTLHDKLFYSKIASIFQQWTFDLRPLDLVKSYIPVLDNLSSEGWQNFT